MKRAEVLLLLMMMIRRCGGWRRRAVRGSCGAERRRSDGKKMVHIEVRLEEKGVCCSGFFLCFPSLVEEHQRGSAKRNSGAEMTSYDGMTVVLCFGFSCALDLVEHSPKPGYSISRDGC
jgi:hypothetical protein